jgi:hypothetical protein
MELILGAGKLDRPVADAEGLLRDWREKERDWGQLYLEYEPITSKDQLFVEDLAVTMLLEVGIHVTRQSPLETCDFHRTTVGERGLQ